MHNTILIVGDTVLHWMSGIQQEDEEQVSLTRKELKLTTPSGPSSPNMKTVASVEEAPTSESNGSSSPEPPDSCNNVVGGVTTLFGDWPHRVAEWQTAEQLTRLRHEVGDRKQLQTVELCVVCGDRASGMLCFLCHQTIK
ncbi:hypothetical protein LAZ67_5000586 [Cordylochernes scorpioides]|uniref:Uncharacterized protein n=1 Tax=Cordylochernes scorpioides TaxID=51811 RepID=A0ABY6KF21_9ARAC|nr:hypothetical protein LAZ67_5000586 [Cordylochernes scorpioides]